MGLGNDGVRPAKVVGAAHVSVTRIEPEVYVPPMPGSAVEIAQGETQRAALFYDQMEETFPIGIWRAGDPLFGNLQFLDGTNGAHVNISGISGVATKTRYATFLLHALFEGGALHRGIRDIPKPVIAAVNGVAIGGGHVLHILCDLTIAADHARFGQAGPRVGSFDAGFGSAYMARILGDKRAREVWYLCSQYDPATLEQWGLVNRGVPKTGFREEVGRWGGVVTGTGPRAAGRRGPRPRSGARRPPARSRSAGPGPPGSPGCTGGPACGLRYRA